MKSQRHVNTFYKGMMQDIDNLQMQKETYLYALNGRVVYNVDGTYAFENAKGTLFVLNVAPNYGLSLANSYIPVGGVEIDEKLVLLLTNGVNSEIGLITEATFGVFTYQTMFNDIYDPYQNKLNFSTQHPMRDFETVTENSLTSRIYFNDNFNEPRVFNIKLGTVPVTVNGVSYFTTPYQPTPNTPITNASRYAPFYSVHGMDQMINLTWGLAKFVKTIGGELLSGSYQYFYRYIHQTGYASPWSAGTGQFFVTIDNVSNNWTTYQMLNSNAQTSKGNLIEIDYLDTRFQQIEVAALYWETDAAPTTGYSFFKADIPASGTIQVQHQFQGSSIDPSTLVQRYTEISKAKTGNLKDNTRHLANYSLLPNVEIDTTGITVAPHKRYMLSDDTRTPDTTTPPFTNQTLTASDTATINMADGLPVQYAIVNDYISYKGVQWAGTFRGHFGGEIYPFAIVVFDKKGQPFFAQHISDFSLPQRYSNQCVDNRISGATTLTFGNAGDWIHTSQNSNTAVTDTQTTENFVLNLLGLYFGGIDLTPILFDGNGQLQVSGFSIVRADRIKQIMGQGLVLSANNSIDTGNNNHIAQPLATSFNGFIKFGGFPYNGAVGGPDYTGSENWLGLGHLPAEYAPQGNPNTYYVGFDPRFDSYDIAPYLNPKYAPKNPTVVTATNIPTLSSVNQVGMFECPDYMIDNGISIGTNSLEGDCIELVNVCTTPYNSNGPISQTNPLSDPNQAAPVELNYMGTGGLHQSYYHKSYRSLLTTDATVLTPDQNNTGAYNGQTNLGDRLSLDVSPQGWFPNVQSGQAVLSQNTQFTYDNHPRVLDYLNWSGYPPPRRYFSYQRKPAIMFRSARNITQNSNNNMFGVLSDSGNGNTAAFIANYIRPIGGYTITLPLLQNRTYKPIGHFVPVNATTLAAVKTVVGGVDKYIFNNVEVWGGDCFLDYFTYYRLYSDLSQQHGDNIDYSIGLSFPVESTFNTILRQGNTYEKLGPEPASQFNDGNGGFADGLYYNDDADNRPEDFNENKVLTASTTQSFAYSAKPATFVPIYDFPVNEIHTGVKVYGELYDTYRLFPVDNLQSADGSKGQINSMQAIFDNLYIIQETAFARIRYNDRETVPASTGNSLVLTANQGYQGHDYIDYIHGTQHQFSVINTTKALHWIDANNGKHMRFAGDGATVVSDDFGMHQYFNRITKRYWGQDNPVGATGILGIFDKEDNSVYYTFSATASTTAETIEFSGKASLYECFHGFTPNNYFQLRGNFFSVDPANVGSLYKHGAGNRGLIYTAYQNSLLRFAINPESTEPKWFDNGRIALNNQAASTKALSWLGQVPDYADQTILFANDLRWKYRQGYMEYNTRGINSPTRLRGQLMRTTLTILNDSSNTLVRISEHESKFRLSPRL